ncbi:MAG: ribosomal RNA small subunit methyltransferase A [Deltaproteobacteria bacterium]|nr:ribosomal RNA small subunit methyltransferase A [Deltaproteobacteria bacterium]
MSEAFPDARTLLKRYGLSAKKSWGQNFLVSERVYRAIVDATVAGAPDWVVEIGSGLGTLTMRLAERVPEGKVIAVERDPDMVAVLKAELEHLDNVEIADVNALKYDLKAVARWQGAPIAVCGNLPYQISSQILFHILAARPHVSRAVVMLQKEMADRILAGPGTKTYGALGVMIQTYADARKVVAAPRGAFVPAPRVDSTVLRLDMLVSGGPRFPLADEKLYDQVVHAAFGQRRKTLKNALGARFEPARVAVALAGAGIDGSRRGETLSLEEFAALANRFKE